MGAKLTKKEKKAFAEAMDNVISITMSDRRKRPNMANLLEEVAELILSARGKHDDPTSLELAQIASVATNMLWQDYMGRKEHLYED